MKNQTSLFRFVCLPGIVVVVDAKYGPQHLQEVKPEGVINEAVR